jgi:GNAT superfamily N-acetyltransferase
MWVYGDEGKVYIRTTQRMIAPGEICPTIDVATVEIDEEFQNQGVFKELLQMVEQKAQQYNRTVFLENVLNEVLIQPLQNYGYSIIADSFPPSFAKSQTREPSQKIKM